MNLRETVRNIMSSDEKVEFFRYSFLIGVLIAGIAVVLPEGLQEDTLFVGISMAIIGFFGWGLTEDPKPVPFVWWLLGWRFTSLEELSDFKLSMYHNWVKFKNREFMSLYKKYTSKEIADALDSAEEEIQSRDTLRLNE